MNDEPKGSQVKQVTVDHGMASPNNPPEPGPDVPKAKVENPDPAPEPPDPVTGRPATEKPPDQSQETHETKEAREEFGRAHEQPDEHQEHNPAEGGDPDEIEGEIDEAKDDGDIEKSKHRGTTTKTASHKRSKAKR